MSNDRVLASLKKALEIVSVDVKDVQHNRHMRVRICCRLTQKFGNITLSASPSDFNVQRQRERQIRKELAQIGVQDPKQFNWRSI
jgi:hypothetical protein